MALAVPVDGTRDFLGLWAGVHADGECAKYWLRELREIKNGGTGECVSVVGAGLNGRLGAFRPEWP